MTGERILEINLKRFVQQPHPSDEAGEFHDPKALMNNVALVAMKFNSENIHVARSLTTEGMNKQQKLAHLSQLKKIVDHDVFEFSTCNRILYLGFNTTCQRLAEKLEEHTGMTDLPFQHYSGIDAWKSLVKICSGLDSFMIGELQVMSQFRSAVAWHRKHDLINKTNESFFHHVVAANRTLRKEFGFNKTTESMLNLATSTLQDILEEKGKASCIVLGFGEMGQKAVETLQQLQQNNITVVSRSPEKSRLRNQALASELSMITFEEWNSKTHASDVVISTIRSAEPTYFETNQIPVEQACTVMDFSWPPSVAQNGVQEHQTLLGMDTWIRAAHKLGVDWDYASTLEKGESVLGNITEGFLSALSNRSDAKFRTFIYSKLDSMSKEWSANASTSTSTDATMQAFSREIATWICTQTGAFKMHDLEQLILQTQREVDSGLLSVIASDVGATMIELNAKSDLAEVLG